MAPPLQDTGRRPCLVVLRPPGPWPAPAPAARPPHTHLGRGGGGGPRSRCGRRAGAASSAAGRARGHGPRRRRAGALPAAPFRPRSSRLRLRPLTARLGLAAQEHPPLGSSPARPRTGAQSPWEAPHPRAAGERRRGRCAPRAERRASRCRSLLARRAAVDGQAPRPGLSSLRGPGRVSNRRRRCGPGAHAREAEAAAPRGWGWGWAFLPALFEGR